MGGLHSTWNSFPLKLFMSKTFHVLPVSFGGQILRWTYARHTIYYILHCCREGLLCECARVCQRRHGPIWGKGKNVDAWKCLATCYLVAELDARTVRLSGGRPACTLLNPTVYSWLPPHTCPWRSRHAWWNQPVTHHRRGHEGGGQLGGLELQAGGSALLGSGATVV